MWLDGHVDHWNVLLNFGNQGVTQVNRKMITEFVYMCLENMMYTMQKSVYVNIGWTVNIAYQSFKFIIPEVVRAKICTSTTNTHPILLEMFHPCQLEERFGGTAKSPESFWPPYVGQYFVPDG